MRRTTRRFLSRLRVSPGPPMLVSWVGQVTQTVLNLVLQLIVVSAQEKHHIMGTWNSSETTPKRYLSYDSVAYYSGIYAFYDREIRSS